MLQMGYRPQMRMPQPLSQSPSAGGGMGSGGMSSGMGGMIHGGGGGQPNLGDVGFDGKMLRKAMARKTVDYHSSVVKYLEVFNSQ